MISPAIIISKYLIQEGIFTDPTLGNPWPVYVSTTPDGDNVDAKVGTVYDTSGAKDGRLMSGTNVFHWGIQVRIRTDDYDEGYNKLVAAAALLELVENVTITINSVDYIMNSITQTTDVVPLGPEDNTKRRDLMTINFLATIKEA